MTIGSHLVALGPPCVILPSVAHDNQITEQDKMPSKHQSEQLRHGRSETILKSHATCEPIQISQKENPQPWSPTATLKRNPVEPQKPKNPQQAKPTSNSRRNSRGLRNPQNQEPSTNHKPSRKPKGPSENPDPT